MVAVGIVAVVILLAVMLYVRSRREINNGLSVPEQHQKPQENTRVVVEEPKEISEAGTPKKPTASKARKTKRAPKSAKD